MWVNSIIFRLISPFLMQFSVFVRKKIEKNEGCTKGKGINSSRVFFIPFPLYTLNFFFNFFSYENNCIQNGKIKRKITEFTHIILLN